MNMTTSEWSKRPLNMDTALEDAVNEVTKLRIENDRLAHALQTMTLKNQMLQQQRDDAESEMCNQDKIIEKLHSDIVILNLKTTENTEEEEDECNLEDSETPEEDTTFVPRNQRYRYRGTFGRILSQGAQDCYRSDGEDSECSDNSGESTKCVQTVVNIDGIKIWRSKPWNDEKSSSDSNDDSEVGFRVPDFDSSTTESLRDSSVSEPQNEQYKYMHYRCVQLHKVDDYHRSWYELCLPKTADDEFPDVHVPQSIRYQVDEEHITVHLLFQCNLDLFNAKLIVFQSPYGSQTISHTTVKNITAKRFE